MSGVVLRCPTCGTTQVTPGECEACSEGTVRYFCDNHTPGLWLDAPACKVCGATVGKAAAKRSAPVGATIPLDRTRRPDSMRADTPRRGEPSSRRPPRREVELEDEAAPSPLTDLLTHLATERERPRFEVEERRSPAPEPEAPRGAPLLRGCLVRILLLVLLFIVLAVAGLLTLFNGIFQ